MEIYEKDALPNLVLLPFSVFADEASRTARPD